MKVELESGEEVKLKDKLSPYDVRDILDQFTVDRRTGDQQGMGSAMFKIVEIVLEGTSKDVDDLELPDIKKIANKYQDQISGFQ